MKYKLVFFCILGFLLLVFVSVVFTKAIESFIIAYRGVSCDYDQGILLNESAGQPVLDSLVKQLKVDITHLEERGSILSIKDKVALANNKSYYHIALLDDKYANNSRCYKSYQTMGDSDWGKSFNCIRRRYNGSPAFTANQKCGKCGEYAGMNKYLLEGIGIKARVVGSIDGAHSWNEVYMGGKWINTDASIPTFVFDNKSNYGNYFAVLVFEGEGEGQDITIEYNNHISFTDKLNKIYFKYIYSCISISKSIVRVLFF